MTDERKRIGDLMCTAGAALMEIGRLMGGVAASNEKRIATDAELDGERGDPQVHKTPKNWKGPKFDGRKFSKCTPEFLDFYAEHKDWCADNPRDGADPKYAKYDRLDAARARGWAKRLRAQTENEAPPSSGGTTDDEWPDTGDATP